jgi:hypothetical protein
MLYLSIKIENFFTLYKRYINYSKLDILSMKLNTKYFLTNAIIVESDTKRAI